jgi:hypothetical protein
MWGTGDNEANRTIKVVIKTENLAGRRPRLAQDRVRTSTQVDPCHVSKASPFDELPVRPSHGDCKPDLTL